MYIYRVRMGVDIDQPHQPRVLLWKYFFAPDSPEHPRAIQRADSALKRPGFIPSLARKRRKET